MRFAPALRFFRKSSAPAGSHDPADLGTAFGMEASLEGVGAYETSTPVSYELESEALARAALESPLAWLSRRSGS
jgi:hypothetical protein